MILIYKNCFSFETENFAPQLNTELLSSHYKLFEVLINNEHNTDTKQLFFMFAFVIAV